MDKFKVGNLVRVKAVKDIPPGYWNQVGPIVEIDSHAHCPYLVIIKGHERRFAEDELEKI